MTFSLSKFGVPLPGQNTKTMKQPKRKDMFRVLMYGFGADTTWGDCGGYMCVSTESCSKPKLKIDVKEVHSFDTTTHYTDKTKWSEITLTVRDNVDNSTATAVHSHIQKQRDYYRRMAQRGKGYGYKFEMMIQTLDGSNPDAVNALSDAVDSYTSSGSDVGSAVLSGTIDTWLLSGCIVSDYDFGEHNYTDSNYNTITLTIQPDNCLLLGSDGHVLLEGSASTSFNLGGFMSGMFTSSTTLSSSLGISGTVTQVLQSTLQAGLSAVAGAGISAIKGLF